MSFYVSASDTKRYVDRLQGLRERFKKNKGSIDLPIDSSIVQLSKRKRSEAVKNTSGRKFDVPINQ